MAVSAALALLLAIVAWVALLRGRLPLELLALALVIAAVLAGLLSPSQALAGFGSPATITVVAMFVISAAVVRSGALNPIERWLTGFEALGPHGQLLLLAAVVGPLSAVLSNTAVVAMFIPLVERWCRRLEMAPTRMLMPLSFLTVLAGVGTLLGTSTNLVASSLSAQLGYGSFGLLQFTPMALITYGAGVVVLFVLAPLVLPHQGILPLAQELESDYQIDGYLSQLLVSPTSSMVGHSIDETNLQHSFDLRVLALIRSQAWLLPPLSDRRVQAGDVLVVKARRTSLSALQDLEGLKLLPGNNIRLTTGLASDSPTTLEATTLSVVEAVVPDRSALIGKTLKELRFAQRTNAAVLAIRRGKAVLRDRLGQVSLKLGDALLLQAPEPSLRALEVSDDLLLAERSEAPSDRRDRLPWTIGLTVGVFMLTLWRSEALAIWALLAVVGLVACRALTPQEVYAAVRWDVVVLLGALLPLAQVMQATGLDRLLIQLLTQTAVSWPPYGVLVALYLATALATEILSNQAAVTLMLPLGLAIGRELGLPPHSVLGVVTFAASHSFLTPIGYQTNTMVFALGNYSFLDFLRLGLPLTIMLCLLTPALALAF